MLNETALSSGTVTVDVDAGVIAGAETLALPTPAEAPSETAGSPATSDPAEAANPAPSPHAAKAAKLLAKRKAAKPAPSTNAKPAPSTNAKPAAVPAAVPAAPTDADRARKREQIAAARECAALAIREFYSGASAPFKAAGIRLKPLNGASRVCGISARQSALLLALATYGASAFRPDGSFIRDAFRVPARLLNPQAPSDVFVNAQPETGCICDGRGVRFHYAGEAAYSNASVIRIDVPGARACILATHGQKLADAFRDLLASYGVLDAIRADAVIGVSRPDETGSDAEAA